MKLKELKELTPEDLVQKEKALKKELFELNFQRKVGNLEKPGRFRVVRRSIARIKTLLKEKESTQKKAK